MIDDRKSVPDPDAGQIAISALFKIRLLLFGNHEDTDKIKIAKEIFRMIHNTHCFHAEIGKKPRLEKWVEEKSVIGKNTGKGGE